MTWEQLVYVLTKPDPHSGPPDDKATKERIPGWIPARLKPDDSGEYRRKSANVIEVSALVLDLDNGEPLPRARDLARGLRAVFHTSWSCTPAHPKGRLVLPFATCCPAARWREVWAAGARWAATAGIVVDPAPKDPARLYFLPAVSADDPRRASWFRAWVNASDDDAWLNWRWLLAAYPEPERKEPPRPVAPTMSRAFSPANDDTRRAKYVAAIVRRRCDDLAQCGQGGRNLSAFRAGAVMGQLEAAGALNAESVVGDLLAAAYSAGLDAREAETAIRNGIIRGRADGPFIFPQE